MGYIKLGNQLHGVASYYTFELPYGCTTVHDKHPELFPATPHLIII